VRRNLDLHLKNSMTFFGGGYDETQLAIIVYRKILALIDKKIKIKKGQ